MYGTTDSLDGGTPVQAIALCAPTAMDDPELHHPFSHQRGRRRRRSPPPLPFRDDVSVTHALAMTPNHTVSPNRGVQNCTRVTHRPRNRPRPRQETPSGSSGTFRGRRRHRSPSIGPAFALSVSAAAAAVRKSSAQPHTRSPSTASSMRHVTSRPSSPHNWLMPATSNAWTPRSISPSRSRRGLGTTNSSSGHGSAKRGHESSPSPRRKMTPFRAFKDLDHAMGSQYGSHDYDHHHHYIHARYCAKPVSRRNHCPSRSGSTEGYYHEEKANLDLATLASRRRRRRQRTQSRPRPRRANTGDSVSSASKGHSNVFGLTTSYYTLMNSSITRLDADGDDATAMDTGTRSSRVQFQMLLDASSDTTSDDEDIDVEMG
ncbi:hypothetical protein SEPCBS119000_001350 [Sporothrix epigloea]|uniref:Uncharacterized protein n=1 Tax=Sporothrix epigloea TaxID=1892477 RepID=A0ABP0DA67_9PEZI